MDIFEADRILDRQHGVPLGGLAEDEAFLEPAAEKQQAIAAAEMSVKAIHFLALNHERAGPQQLAPLHTGLERRILLGIPGIGLRDPARQPDVNHGVGFGNRLSRSLGPRTGRSFAARVPREARAGGSDQAGADEITACNVAFHAALTGCTETPGP